MKKIFITIAWLQNGKKKTKKNMYDLQNKMID